MPFDWTSPSPFPLSPFPLLLALEAKFLHPPSGDDAPSLCVHRPLRPEHLTVTVFGADFIPRLREVDTARQLTPISGPAPANHFKQLAAIRSGIVRHGDVTLS